MNPVSDTPTPPTAAGTSIGLDAPLAGLLAYALGWLSGLAMLLLEKRHPQVRFHAAQSLVLFGGATVWWVAVAMVAWVPVLGWVLTIVGLLFTPVFMGLWIYLMVRGYQLADVRLPLIAGVADRLVAGTSTP